MMLTEPLTLLWVAGGVMFTLALITISLAARAIHRARRLLEVLDTPPPGAGEESVDGFVAK